MEHGLRFDAVVPVAFGGIGVRITGEEVIEMLYVPGSIKAQVPKKGLGHEVARQIRAYFRDPHFRFSLPLTERGTPFQRDVWRAITQVPCGSTCSYGDIARLLRTGPRAVGQACGANWFSLVIPCHRVLAADGVGGFGRHDDDGFHMSIKRWLLRHEGVLDHA